MGKDFILNPDLQSDDEDDAVGGGIPDDDGWIWVRGPDGALHKQRKKEELSATPKKPRRKAKRPSRRRS